MHAVVRFKALPNLTASRHVRPRYPSYTNAAFLSAASREHHLHDTRALTVASLFPCPARTTFMHSYARFSIGCTLKTPSPKAYTLGRVLFAVVIAHFVSKRFSLHRPPAEWQARYTIDRISRFWPGSKSCVIRTNLLTCLSPSPPLLKFLAAARIVYFAVMVCLTDLYAALFGLFIARRYIRSEFSSMKSCMICCETTQMLWMVRAAFRLFIRRVRKYGRRKAYTCACVFMESPLTSRFVSGLPHLPHLLHPPRHPVLHFRRRAYPSLPPSVCHLSLDRRHLRDR